jgi:hypothetical protein
VKARPTLLVAFTIGIGAVLLWLFLLLTGMTGQELALALRNLRPVPILGISAAVALSTAAGAEKWRLVEGHLSGRYPTRRHAFGLSALGSALGQFMPAPVASALVRGGGTHLLTGAGGRRGALSSVWEQVFDIGVIVMATVPALIALRLGDFRAFLLGAPVLAAVGDRLIGKSTRFVGRILPGLAGPLLDASLSQKLYRLSLIKFLALIGMTLGVADAIGSSIPPLPLAAAIPPVAVAGTLSFVPAGLGVNEWSFVFVLGLSGIAQHTVATFALMNRLLVGFLSIGLGLASAIAVRHAPRGSASGITGDDPYRNGFAGKPLQCPLDGVQSGADEDEDRVVAQA